jgi:hypothetical protein
MRLSKFIQENMEQIMEEWENFARTIPAPEYMSHSALRDHIKELLEFIIRDIETYQDSLSQSERSKGRGPEEGGPDKNSPGQTHAELRSASGFDVVQIASEYRALRASIIKLWTKKLEKIDQSVILDLIRFNEAIDQAFMESIVRFKRQLGI